MKQKVWFNKIFLKKFFLFFKLFAFEYPSYQCCGGFCHMLHKTNTSFRQKIKGLGILFHSFVLFYFGLFVFSKEYSIVTKVNQVCSSSFYRHGTFVTKHFSNMQEGIKTMSIGNSIHYFETEWQKMEHDKVDTTCCHPPVPTFVTMTAKPPLGDRTSKYLDRHFQWELCSKECVHIQRIYLFSFGLVCFFSK